MKKMIAACVFALTVCVQSSVHAEGMFYKLPKDGTWAEFTIDGVGTNPDDTEVTLIGKIRMSSVGKVQVDGKPCRWIELQSEGKRNEEKFTDTLKMLIPEKNLAKGQDPIEHIIRAWSQHSHVPGGPRAVDLNEAGKDNLRNRTFQFFHGPYKNAQKLEKSPVESKLGKVECEGVKATETWQRTKCTYEIRLHEKAPFGVVAYQAIFDLMEKGAVTTKFTLTDMGTDAESALPDAN